MTAPSGQPLPAAQHYVFLGGGNMASAMIGGLVISMQPLSQSDRLRAISVNRP